MTLFVFIFFSLSVFAGAPTYQMKRVGDTLTFDFNQDKKVDYLEKFRDGKLIETQYDLDADGKMDQLTILDPETEVFKIVDIAKNSKSVKKRITYWNHDVSKKTIVFTQVDKNNDGIWDNNYQTETSIDQKREDCPVAAISSQSETLAQNIQSACLRSDDYVATDFGYRIHRSCTGPGKDWVMPAIRESIHTGLQCLTRLSQEGMRGAAKNLSALESILSTNNVQILCNETSYGWGRDTLAHATTGGEDAQRFLPLVHPGISFNPSILREDVPTVPEDLLQFKETAFHEQLHHLGNRHGVDPEISYTCGKCCFPGPRDTPEKTDTACRVCGGDYASLTDPEYLRDITAYGEANYASEQALSASLAYLRENPTNNLGMAYLAVNSAGVFGPVGIELGSLLSGRTDLTEDEKALVARATRFDFYEPLNPYRPGARVIAQTYLKMYQEQDPRGALAYIRANADLIQAQLRLNEGVNGIYIRDNLKENLNNLITEVWYRGYRGASPPRKVADGLDELATEAFALKDLFGF